MRLILPVLFGLSMTACGTVEAVTETRLVYPSVPDELTEPVAMPPVTETDPVLQAAQGVSLLLMHVDRLEGDRAAVRVILGGPQ